MRIAQVAPLYESVPPSGYGGTERVIAALCDHLVAAGHDVTLYAAGSSITTADLVEVVPSPLRSRMSSDELAAVAPHLHLKMLADVYRRAADFDIVHSHADLWTLPFAASAGTPTLTTLHSRLDLPSVATTLAMYPGHPLVAVSDAQRRSLDGVDVRWAGTVHNGLDLDRYRSHEPIARGDHLAFVGRIHPEKGPPAAIEVAIRTGRRLRVAAKVDPFELDYFCDVVEPLFAAYAVEFVGEIPEADKPAFFASAAATVFPSDWPEPFGLVMIESMAAGTPVIALDRGAVREVLVDGRTGFVCRDVDEMVQAVERLDEIDPDECRRHATRFDVRTMGARYEELYEGLTRASTRGRLGRLRVPPRAHA